MSNLNNIATPAYTFCKNELIESYNTIKALLGNVRTFYALKANAHKEVLLVLAHIGADFEVASIGEFNVLLDIGVPAERIICGLPIKPIGWLKTMYDTGCNYFVFDTIDEMNKIKEHATKSKKILRVNVNDLLPKSIDYGMPYEEIIELISTNNSFVEAIDGVSFHISNNTSIKNFNLVMDRIESILNSLNKSDLILNIGGGYRIKAEDGFYTNLQQRISYFSEKFKTNVIAEPGNNVVNSCGRILTTVIGIRKRDEYNYDLYIDIGKPSGLKTDEKRIPSYIKQVSGEIPCKERKYRFIDITCMHLPHFSIVLNSKVSEGDIFEFGGMGAYSICLRSDFHAWTYPNVVLY